MRAAQAWGGLLPSQFDALDDKDKAMILAWYRSTQTMAAVEAVEQEREIRRGRHKA